MSCPRVFCWVFSLQSGVILTVVILCTIFIGMGVMTLYTIIVLSSYEPYGDSYLAGITVAYTHSTLVVVALCCAFIGAYSEKHVLMLAGGLLMAFATLVYLVASIVSYLPAFRFACIGNRCPDHVWMQESYWRLHFLTSKDERKEPLGFVFESPDGEVYIDYYDQLEDIGKKPRRAKPTDWRCGRERESRTTARTWANVRSTQRISSKSKWTTGIVSPTRKMFNESLEEKERKLMEKERKLKEKGKGFDDKERRLEVDTRRLEGLGSHEVLPPKDLRNVNTTSGVLFNNPLNVNRKTIYGENNSAAVDWFMKRRQMLNNLLLFNLKKTSVLHKALNGVDPTLSSDPSTPTSTLPLDVQSTTNKSSESNDNQGKPTYSYIKNPSLDLAISLIFNICYFAFLIYTSVIYLALWDELKYGIEPTKGSFMR